MRGHAASPSLIRAAMRDAERGGVVLPHGRPLRVVALWHHRNRFASAPFTQKKQAVEGWKLGHPEKIGLIGVVRNAHWSALTRLPRQFRTRNELIEAKQTQSNSNETAAKSTNPVIILPLITVW
jgi:hypothetical protein